MTEKTQKRQGCGKVFKAVAPRRAHRAGQPLPPKFARMLKSSLPNWIRS